MKFYQMNKKPNRRKECDMKLKVYALIFFIASLCFASMAWVQAEVKVPDRIKNVTDLYKGAEVEQAMETEEFAQVVYSVSAELKKVLKWYKDIMQKKGWKVVMEMNMANNSILNLAKDNSTVVVNAQAKQEGQTTVHLVVEDK
jgi:chorismate mutase